MSVKLRSGTGPRSSGPIGSQLSAAFIAALLLVAPAFAGDWKLTDSVVADLTYVDRSGRRSSSGAVLQLTPGVKLAGQGGRSRANLDYRLTASTGTRDTDPKNVTHRLRANGRVEVVENAFFLGANASARLVGNSATSGNVDSINANSDGRQSYSFQVTPEFRHHLNQYADIVSNNKFNYVTYSGGSGSSSDDSTSLETHIGIRNGHYFGPLSWNANARQRRTKYNLRDDKRTSYDVGAGYRFDASWQIRGSVGYEKNEVQTSRRDTNGATWSVGANWTPNTRTNVSADYGSRYQGKVFSGAVTHHTRHTVLSLDFSRDISNRRTAQLVDSFFVLIDPTTGERAIDPVTGEPFPEIIIPELQQTDEDFVNTQVRAAVSVSGRRTSATLTADVSNRKYEISPIDEDSYGLSLNLTRQLGQGFSGSLRSSVTRADATNSGDSDSYDVQMSLRKRLSQRTSASLQFLHRERDSSGGAGDYTENRIGVSLRSSFL